MRSDFLEPERGSGVVGWAVRQLALWLVGGLALYWVASAYGLLPSRGRPAAVNPLTAAAEPAEAPAVDKPVLGRPAPLVINSLALRAQPDGYVYVQAAVNGLPMRMAFDTGAALVSLTPQDAAKAGVAGNLNYSQAFGTANGRALGAPVTLREVRIGQLVITDVPAVVMQNLGVSLLGQSFLKRLDGYEMKDHTLTLSWR